jgi:DNA-binding YbaB/EbfC family protein
VAQFDLSSLFQQAQALQEKFKQMQEDVAAKTVQAEAGGGMVRAVADGSMRVRSIEVDPSLFAANDREMLQDLIVVAINDALRRAQELVSQEMGKLSPLGGLNIPGLLGGRGE